MDKTDYKFILECIVHETEIYRQLYGHEYDLELILSHKIFDYIISGAHLKSKPERICNNRYKVAKSDGFYIRPIKAKGCDINVQDRRTISKEMGTERGTSNGNVTKTIR